MRCLTSTVRWLLVGVACAAPIAIASAAEAAGDPVAGCGKGNQLVTLEDGLDSIDWRIYSTEEEAELRALFPTIVDTNGDGWWCMKQFGPSVGISNKWTDREYADYIVTRLSDNKSNGQLG